MRGYLISFLSLFGLVFFSFCLFLSDGLIFFWLFLELGTLSLVPSFFLIHGVGVLESLFSYLIVSSVSSSMIVCGVLFESLSFFLVLGMLIKFGLFPFFGWVYKVVVKSNWSVVWGFSTFLKSSFVFLCFFLCGGGSLFVEFLCGITLLFLGGMFWVFSYSWRYCWCHMMISSSVCLVAMSMVLSADSLIWLFVVYLCWASLVILYLSYLDSSCIEGVGAYFLFVVVLVSFPCSLSIFYKLIMGVCIYSCSFLVFSSWVVYSVLEQFYVVKYLVGSRVPGAMVGFCSLV